MKLRNRGRDNVAQNTTRSSSNNESTASASTSATNIRQLGSSSSRPTRGKSRPLKKILKEKNELSEPAKSETLDAMADVFQKCQHLHYHDDCRKKLVEQYHATTHREFCAKFIHFIKIILRSDPKNPHTKHSIQFLPKLINTLDYQKRVVEVKADETNDELGESIFGEEMFTDAPNSSECVLDYVLSECLIKELGSPNTTVRQNDCSIILRLLHGINDIRRDVYNSLQTALLDRLADRNYLVRALAAYALRRFQDTVKVEDQVLTAYRFHLTKDPAFQVRLAVLMSIEVTPDTLHFIIKKTKDVKAVIRKQAYIKIAEHVNLTLLSFEQRLMILREGLNDRHPNVRRVVEEKLLASWLKQCNDDLVKLLAEIGVQSDGKILKKTLNILFNQQLESGCDEFGTKLHSSAHHFRESYLDSVKLLLEEHLTPEKVFLWACFNTFIKSNEEKFIQKADKNFSKITETNKRPKITHSDVEDDPACVDTIAEEWSNHNFRENSPDSNDTHIADYLFPELPHICQFLQKFVDSIDSLIEPPTTEELADKEFIYNHLVNLLLLYDVCDDAQQNYLLEMIRTIIFSPNLHIDFQDCISPIMKFIARRIFKDSNHLLDFTAECTSKVYNLAAETSAEEASAASGQSKSPETNASVEKTYDVDYARLTVEIEEYRDQFDRALSAQDYMAAQNFKNKLDELTHERDQLQTLRMQTKDVPVSAPSQAHSSKPFDLNDHPEALLKCLQIFVGALEHGKFESANSVIFSHIDKIVLHGVINREVRIRKIAVKALGLSCLMNDTLFQQHCNLILQVLKYDIEPVRVIALYSFFDCLCKHGIEPLLKKKQTKPTARRISRRQIEEDLADLNLESEDAALMGLAHLGDLAEAETEPDINQSMIEDDENDEDEDEEADLTIVQAERSRYFETLDKDSEQGIIDSLIALFTEKLFNCDSDLIEQSSIEGFAKLMILGVIYSPQLLSRLIIIWYLPETNPNILQFLGVFLPIYIGSESKYVREDDHITVTGQTCLVDCFIDTLEVLFEAKNNYSKEFEELRLYQYLPNINVDSQYRQIDLKNVLNFMLNLVRANHYGHLLTNIIHKIYSIVTSSDDEYCFYEDFMIEILLKAALKFNLSDFEDTTSIDEIRPVMREIIIKMTNRIDNMRALSRKKAEKFIKCFHVFYKSLKRDGTQNSFLNQSSTAHDTDDVEIEDLPGLNNQSEEVNMDPLDPEPGTSDSSKENIEENDSDEEKAKSECIDEENGNDDEDNGEVDLLSNVSETLHYSDVEDIES